MLLDVCEAVLDLDIWWVYSVTCGDLVDLDIWWVYSVTCGDVVDLDIWWVYRSSGSRYLVGVQCELY